MELNEDNTLIFFWNSSCNVCGPLYDKLELLMQNDFPKLQLKKVNIADTPEYRAKYHVFSSPLILLLLDGKEYLRSGGNVSIFETKQKIRRLYDLKFDK